MSGWLPRAASDPVQLILAFPAILARVGWLTLVVELVAHLPAIVLIALGLLPGWSVSLWHLLVGSFIEAGLVGAWVKREFGREPAAGPDFGAARRAFFRVLGVNLVTTMVASLGELACCIGIGVSGLFFAAVPIVVLEGRGVFDALKEAWSRTEGKRVPIFFASLAMMSPQVIVGTVLAVLGAVLSLRGANPRLVHGVEATTALVSAVTNVFPMLFQIVIWLATRPIRKPGVPGPAGTV